MWFAVAKTYNDALIGWSIYIYTVYIYIHVCIYDYICSVKWMPIFIEFIDLICHFIVCWTHGTRRIIVYEQVFGSGIFLNFGTQMGFLILRRIFQVFFFGLTLQTLQSGEVCPKKTKLTWVWPVLLLSAGGWRSQRVPKSAWDGNATDDFYKSFTVFKDRFFVE